MHITHILHKQLSRMCQGIHKRTNDDTDAHGTELRKQVSVGVRNQLFLNISEHYSLIPVLLCP